MPQSWELFSKAVEAAPDEDFDKWDDYIEWKAYLKMAQDLTSKIDKVERGNSDRLE